MHREFKYRMKTVRLIVGLPWYVTYLFANDFHVLKITWCRWCLNAGDLPEHKVVGMPNLSPTMETGTIISWMKKEGKVLVTIMIILQFGNWKTKPVKTSCVSGLCAEPSHFSNGVHYNPFKYRHIVLCEPTRKQCRNLSGAWCWIVVSMIATFSVSDSALLQGWIYMFWLAPLTTSN